MSKSKGRGRGRGGVSLNIEAIGFGRGEQLPTPALQPPPLQPPLRKQPIPLSTGDEANYLLALRKEFMKTMKNSPYYIRAEVEKTDVQRYSDKYRLSTQAQSTTNWEPDWRRLPKELKISTIRKKKRSGIPVVPNLSKSRKKDEVELKKKLEDLEKKDVESENKVEEKEGGDEEESDAENIEGVYDQEEEEEEENDYLTSYFDNGESFLDEEEDNLEDKDGGVY